MSWVSGPLIRPARPWIACACALVNRRPPIVTVGVSAALRTGSLRPRSTGLFTGAGGVTVARRTLRTLGFGSGVGFGLRRGGFGFGWITVGFSTGFTGFRPTVATGLGLRRGGFGFGAGFGFGFFLRMIGRGPRVPPRLDLSSTGIALLIRGILHTH